MKDELQSGPAATIPDNLTSLEAEEARRLFDALQILRDAYSDMTVSQAAALLFIAFEPADANMTDIRTALGVAASTATRAVVTLSNASRGVNHETGPGLVTQTADARDRRWRLTRCTPEGLEVVRQAIKALRSKDV